MIKVIKKYGSSFVVRISPDEMKYLGLKKGDAVDVEIKPRKQQKYIGSK